MDQIKRKLSFDQSSEEKIKKLQNEYDQSVTCIENLSNELFYEILDYLDGCDIYRAFSILNHRFQQLLNSSSLLFKIKLNNSTSEKEYMNNSKPIILGNKHKMLSIHSLTLTNDNQTISSLIHLQTHVFSSIKPEILHLLLLRLVSLTIHTCRTLKDLSKIYQSIFQLPKLKYMKFSTLKPKKNFNITVSLPISINNQFSPIEYLVIDHPCTFNELFAIISYTPQLRRLNYMKISNNNSNIRILSPIPLVNLTCIYIDICDIMFNEFEILISKISSKLIVLSFTTLSEDMTYLDAHRWEEFILKYQPNLEKFYLKFCANHKKGYEPKLYHGDGITSQFISPFWIERQWIYEGDIDFDKIIYSIRPYKKRWYDDGVINSSTQFSKSSRLILTACPTTKHFLSLKRNIFRIMIVAKIFHLEIYEETFIDMLIEILISLLTIKTLSISSFSLSHSEGFSDDNTKVLNFYINHNPITKIYLKKMNTIEEIYYLMKLCPRMIYLRIDSINNMNIELFLRNILEKIKHECNEYLRLLCLHISTVDDDIIKKIDKMISSEKLLFDYTIKRIVDNIYLQWI